MPKVSNNKIQKKTSISKTKAKTINPQSEDQTNVVWVSTGSNQTKAQKEFNDALGKHKETQNKVKEAEALFTLVNERYLKDVIPEIEKQKSMIKKRYTLMFEILTEEKCSLSVTQREFIRRYLMESAYELLSEDNAFYLGLIEVLETKAEKQERLGNKRRAEAQIKQKFGVDIDLDELNQTEFDSEEERQAHDEKFREFREKFEEYRNNHYEKFGREDRSQERKKSKAQIEKEKKISEAEKMISLDINSLFKSLTKLIHPDKELDPVLREKKSQIMRNLSGARDNMNIAEILEIKMQVDELIPDNQTEVSFNDKTIKRFVSIIKTKIKELEMMISRRLFSHPLLESYPGRSLSPESLRKYVEKIVNDNRSITKVIQIDVERLERDPKHIKNMIRSLQEY
ncbi:MAG: hypothetical protein SH817_09630 [Leptospira sp.]|nr:hypothetical protein [Leptospira sp.]